MKVQNDFVQVKEKDAKELSDSIVEVEAYKELYEKAARQPNYSSAALKDVLDCFMQSLKKHKALWREFLFKYVGEENALYYRDMYKFDVYKKVIFLPESEGEGNEVHKN